MTLGFVALRESAAATGATDDFLVGFQSTFRYAAGFLGALLAVTCLRPRLWFKRRALSIGDP